MGTLPIQTPQERALRTLDRMAEIVAAEALVSGSYEIEGGMIDAGRLTPEEAKNAPCGGNLFCAVGSLYFAGGVHLNENGCLPGTTTGSPRERFLARPENEHIKIAYDALNEAACQWADSEDGQSIGVSSYYIRGSLSGALECLFEHYYTTDGDYLTTDDLLRVIAIARRRITVPV